MKRFVAGLLAVLLLLTFVGCADQKSGEYDHIVRLLEAGKYDAAKEAIDQLPGNAPTEATVAAAPAVTEPIEKAPVEETPAEEIPVEETVAETEAATTPSYEFKKVLTGTPITKVDNLGNESTDNYYFFEYDDQGRVTKIGGHENAITYGIYLFTFADYLRVSYGADGTVENVKVVDSWDNVAALGTPTYNEYGNMIQMHIQTNSEEYTLNFTYDANGNRVRSDIYTSFWEEIAFDIQYTYDAEGRLTREVWNVVGFGVDGRTIDYTYDENGNLTESCTTWHDNKSTQETTVYTLDEDGDIRCAVTTTDSKDSGYKTKTRDYKYKRIRVTP